MNILSSYLLSKYPRITHGFTTKYTDQEKLNNSNYFTFLKQVHGNRVLYIPANRTGKLEGDALVTSKTGITIGVKTADCVPILLFEHKKGIVGVIHAGWKGTSKHIVQKAVSKI